MSKQKQEPVEKGYKSLFMPLVALMFLEIPPAMAQVDDDTKFSISRT